MEVNNHSEALTTLRLDLNFPDIQVEVDWFRKLKQSEVANEHWHCHGSTELHFMIEGENRIDFGDGHIQLLKGDILLIPAKVMHKLRNTSGDDYERYVLSFSIVEAHGEDAHYLKEVLFGDQVAKICLTEEIKSILQECSHEMEEKKIGYVSIIKLDVMKLLFCVAREISGHQVKSVIDEELYKVTYNTKNAQDIEAYIKKNAELNLTVSDITEYMHLSSRHVQRLVRAEYGCTTKEMIDAARIMCAKKYLKETQYSVKQIAMLMGFNSTQSFCRFVKRNIGQSPKEYRNGSMGKG